MRLCLGAQTLGIGFSYLWVHRRVRWCLVWVPGQKVRIVGVVMRVVSLWVVVCALPVALAVVVVSVVLVRVGRCLEVLVRVRVHVMMVALLLPCWHHLHHVAHGVHVAVGDGTRVVGEGSFQPLRGEKRYTQHLILCFQCGWMVPQCCIVARKSQIWKPAWALSAFFFFFLHYFLQMPSVHRAICKPSSWLDLFF